MILRELLAVFGINFDDKGQKKAEEALTGLKSKAVDVGESFSKIGSVLGSSAIVAGIAATITSVTRAAGEAAATVQRTNAMFGENADTIVDWSEKSSRAMGRGADDMLTLANDAKPIIDNFAKTEEEAQKNK